MHRLALGTVQFGMNYGIANKYGQVGKNKVTDILNYAFNAGIKTLDTASGYGQSEEIIGQYLNESNNKAWSIIAKVNGPIDKLYDQLNQTIMKLGTTPYALLAHSAKDYNEQLFYYELYKMKEKYSIEKVGVSVYSNEDIDYVLAMKIPDIIQCPMNILDTRLFRAGTLFKMENLGIEVHIRSVFLQGLFYLSDEELQEKFLDAFYAIKQLKLLAKSVGLTLAELSLLWVCSLDQVDKVIIGVDNVEQLKAHRKTLNKKVDSTVFEEALSIKYENEYILNPSLWPVKF